MEAHTVVHVEHIARALEHAIRKQCSLSRFLRPLVKDRVAVIHAECALMKLVFTSADDVLRVQQVSVQQIQHGPSGEQSLVVEVKAMVGDPHIVYDVAGLPVARRKPKPQPTDSVEVAMLAGLRNLLPQTAKRAPPKVSPVKRILPAKGPRCKVVHQALIEPEDFLEKYCCVEQPAPPKC
jgi:hypothetical protein